MSAVISRTSATGNASGAGLPAANGIMPGTPVAFNTSLMAEGLSDAILSEKRYSIFYLPFRRRL